MRCLLNFLVLESAIAELSGAPLNVDSNVIPAAEAVPVSAAAAIAPATEALDQLQVQPVESKKDLVDLKTAVDELPELDAGAAEGLGAFVQASEPATVYAAPLGLLDVPFLSVNSSSSTTQPIMQVMTVESHEEEASSRSSAAGISTAAAAGGVAVLAAGAFAVHSRMKRRRAQTELSRFGSPHRNGSSELPRRFFPV